MLPCCWGRLLLLLLLLLLLRACGRTGQSRQRGQRRHGRQAHGTHCPRFLILVCHQSICPKVSSRSGKGLMSESV
jgi:hypothetical protein